MSEKQKHTPGPWEVDADNIHAGNVATLHGDNGTFAEIWSRQWLTEQHCDQHANASRIVACVNACEGIADPSAVPGLLEACKSALALIEISTDYKGMSTSRELRAAIAKATQ